MKKSNEYIRMKKTKQISVWDEKINIITNLKSSRTVNYNSSIKIRALNNFYFRFSETDFIQFAILFIKWSPDKISYCRDVRRSIRWLQHYKISFKHGEVYFQSSTQGKSNKAKLWWIELYLELLIQIKSKRQVLPELPAIFMTK